MPDDEELPNWPLLEQLSTAPDTQLDGSMTEKLRALCAQSTIMKPHEVRTALHEILDYCVQGGLASTFVMKILDWEWRRLGGSSDDPAPWREGVYS